MFRVFRASRVSLVVLGLLSSLAAQPETIFAHRLPPEVTVYLKVDATEGPRLRVAVRVPTAILLDAGLPRVETVMLDLRTIDTRLGAVAAEVARSLDVTDGGQPLTPGPSRTILSVLGDRSFESFDGAVSHIAGPPLSVDRAVYWNEAYVDVQFDYRLATLTPRIEARLNGLRMGGGDFSRTRATFMPASGLERTVAVSGPPQRVLFEPTAQQAASTLLARSVDGLAREHLLWWFVLCLAIHPGAWSSRARPLAVFLSSHVALVAWVALRASPFADATVDLAQFVLGGAVVLAALQAFFGSSPSAITAITAITATAACAGAASAIVIGRHVHEWMPLAGAHGAAAVGAIAVVIVAVAVGAFTLLRHVIPLPYRWNAPAWLIAAAWVAAPAHEASHVMVDAAATLQAAEVLTLRPAVQFVLTHGAFLSLLLFAGLVVIVSRFGRRTSPGAGWPASS